MRPALLQLAAVALAIALLGPDPTSQCEADFGSTCNNFSCDCAQG